MSNEKGIKQVGDWVDQVSKQLDLAVKVVARKLALDAWQKLTDKTPVDTGRARASWGIAVGAPSEWVPAEGSDFAIPPQPDAQQIDGTATIYINSNLVYMEALEMGHSKQAPFGMVRITIAELAAELESTIGGLNL